MRLRLYHHSDGARVAYREVGAGPPLALLHAGLLSHCEWEPGLGRVLSHATKLVFTTELGMRLSERHVPEAGDLIRHAFADVPANPNLAPRQRSIAGGWIQLRTSTAGCNRRSCCLQHCSGRSLRTRMAGAPTPNETPQL